MLKTPRTRTTTSVAMLGLVTLALGAPQEAGGQIRIGVRAGAVATWDLVRDSIVEPITVRPNAAGYIGATLDTQIESRYRAGVALQVSRSNLVSRTPLVETEITTLTIWHPSATLAHRLSSWITIEAKAGALIYAPGRRTGTIFRDGAPVSPVIGLAVAVTRSVGSRFEAALDVAYDAHRFTTPTLQNFGFTGQTTVHRMAFGVTVRRTNGAQNR